MRAGMPQIDADAPTEEPPAAPTDPHATGAPITWSAPVRVAFRFLFAYVVLYVLPVERPLRRLVEWVGTQLAGERVRALSNGSGDTSFDYAALAVELALAAAVTVAWTVRDRRREYESLAGWLHVLVRYYLGMQMLTYGAAKVFPVQFPHPNLVQLTQPLGEFSPMGLLWVFMGHTYAFNLFTGLGEAVGGMLLLFRRTALAGALVLLAVLANVVVLNYAFDVPVKLFATHLMLMDLLLVAPNVRRLVDVFVLNRPAARMWLGPTPSPAWARARRQMKPVAVGLLVLGTFGTSAFVSMQRGDPARSTPLYGVYDVVSFTRNGRTLPPLLTDSTRWHRVVFPGQRSMVIRMGADAKRSYGVSADTTDRTLRVYSTAEIDSAPRLRYAFVDGMLHLDGVLDGDTLAVRMRRVDHTKFLLTSRGYRWVNEFPFNR